jgi:hypothetical protein
MDRIEVGISVAMLFSLPYTRQLALGSNSLLINAENARWIRTPFSLIGGKNHNQEKTE